MYCRGAEMVAVGDAAEGDAMRARVLNRLIYRQGAGFKRQTVVRIDQASAAFGPDDPRHRLAVRAPIAQMCGVIGCARDTMTGEAFLFRSNECTRSRRGHGRGRTGGGSCFGHKIESSLKRN